MKRMNFLSLVIIATLLIPVSCRKNPDIPVDPKLPTIPIPIPQPPVCRLTGITGSSGTTTTNISLSYNNDGEVSVIRQTGTNPFTRVLTYNGTIIKVITTNQAGTVTKRDSIQLNSNKLIAFSQTTDLVLNRTTVNRFSYNNLGQLTQSTSQTGTGPVNTTTYTFSNGDLIALNAASRTTYTHYIDRPLADGDFLKLFQLINTGAFIVQNVHLLKSQQTGATLQNYVYDFDASGKIIKLTGTTESTIETLNYQYECK